MGQSASPPPLKYDGANNAGNCFQTYEEQAVPESSQHGYMKGK